MRRLSLIGGLFLVAAGPAGAQRTIEGQVHGLGIIANRSFVGGGLGLAVRPTPRVRFSLTGSLGSWEGVFGGRGELLGTFHPTASRRSGVTAYGGAGVAIVAAGGATQEYLVLLIGLEARPGPSSGWFLEAGAGGGVRVAAGWRIGPVRAQR